MWGVYDTGGFSLQSGLAGRVNTHSGVLTTRDAFFSVHKCKNCHTVFYIPVLLLAVALTTWDPVYRLLF